MSNIICPMHPDPKPTCDEHGLCPVCLREWEDTQHGLMSKPRKVILTKAPLPGTKIDDCLQLVKEN